MSGPIHCPLTLAIPANVTNLKGVNIKSKLALLHQTKIAIAIAAILIAAPAYSGTFYPVIESGCTNPPINAGKQYRDPYYSGVAQDRWSVLYRWQGRLHPPPQYVDWAYNAFTPVSWDIGR